MRILPTGPDSAPEHGSLNKAERSRLIWLGAAFVVVASTFFYFLRGENERRKAARAERPQALQTSMEEVVVTPRVLHDQLQETRDRTPEERVIVETAPLAAAFLTVKDLKDAHFEPMGGRVLDAATAEALLADPDPVRGSVIRAYGWIESLESRDATPDLPQRVRGRLRLENGGNAWFTAISMPADGAGVGDFVRMDGLFLKVHRGEAQGSFLDAPLLVGLRLVNSKPAMGVVSALPPDLFGSIRNDSLQEGLSSLPHEAYWTLVGYSRDMPAEGVDWSRALVLDKEGMARIAGGEEGLHGIPVRIPSCEVMGVWRSAQKENPLRMTHLTEGWLGSQDWMGPSRGLVHFAAPFDPGRLGRGDEVVGRGFFLKNLAYEPRDGGIEIAPFFVLHSLEARPPVDNTVFQRLLYGAGTLLLGLLALMAVVLLRDRRKSHQLQEQLAQRRRARRARPA